MEPWLRVLADAVCLAVIAAWLPARAVMRPWWGTAGMAARMGLLPVRPCGARRVLWLHAVSIGEMLSARPLVEELRAACGGGLRVQLTAGNTATLRTAEATGFPADAAGLLPWDFGPAVRTALERVRPDVLVVMECELWPRLLDEARRAGVPIVVANARIYGRDLAGYLRARRLFAPVVRGIDVVAAADEAEAGRWLALGARPGAVEVTGSTKSDAASPDRWPVTTSTAGLRAGLLRWKGGGPLVVLASTHAGEEAAWLAGAGELRVRVPGVRWLIAPRHPARAGEVAGLARGAGCGAVLRSELPQPIDGDVAAIPDAAGAVVLDTLGELAGLLPAADVVIVGGSLVPAGGQNPLEAAACGRAMIAGPHMENFAAAARGLDGAGAWCRVVDPTEGRAVLAGLLVDEAMRARMGGAARAWWRSGTGVAARLAGRVAGLMDGAGGTRA